MNTREAAEYLKLHYVTLYKLAQQGHIPASKIGGAWRFNKDILDRWLAQQSLGVLGNVLIVDDDPAILEMLSDIVSREEYKAVAVESGEKALEELQKQQFDLIFLDLLLPGMSGVEVLTALKKMGSQASVAILTGYADDPMANEALLMEPKFLIRKPFRVSEIIEVINSLGSPMVQEEAKTEGQQVLSHFLGPKRHGQRIKVGEPDTSHPSEPDEAKFREMLDQLPEMIFEADIQGNFVYANRIALESFGYSPEDMERGVNVLQLVTPEDRDKAKNSIMKLMSGEEVGANEYIVRRKDGSEFHAMVHSSLLTDDEGHAVGFRGMVIRLGTSDQLEEMLWESEEERRIVFDSIGDAIVVTDLAGRILKANDAAAHMVKVPSKEQLVGRNAFNFIAAKDRPVALDTLKDGRMDGAVKGQIEYVLVTADGDEFNADVGVSLLRDGSGNPTGFIGVARDITERKRAEEILRQSEEDYRTLFESTIDGMAVIDYETMKVVLANETAFRMYGFDPKDEIDKIDLLDHVHPDDREAVIASLAEDMFVKDLRQIVDFRTLTKDGQIKWVSGLGTKFKYHGKTAGLISFRDITEQKRAEDALRESEEKLRNVFDSTSEGLSVTDLSGNIVDINEAAVHMHGYGSREELIGRSSLELVAKRDRKIVANEARNAAKRRLRTYSGEYTLARADGTEFEAEYSGALLYDAFGNPTGYVGSSRDITERKRAEEALRESEERYRNLIENSQEMVQSVTPEGRFIFVNRAWHDILGYSDKDLKRLTLLDIIHPDSLDHCREHFNKVIHGETVTQIEAKFKARDGSVIHVEGDASPRYIGDQIVGTHGFFRDITKNKQKGVK